MCDDVEYSEEFVFILSRVDGNTDEIVQVSSRDEGLNFYEIAAKLEAALQKFGFGNDFDDYVKSKYL